MAESLVHTFLGAHAILQEYKENNCFLDFFNAYIGT